MQVEILSNQSNSVIAATPGRHFPGILLQGDTISNVFDDLKRVYDFISQQSGEEVEDAKYNILSILELLEDNLRHYEYALTKHDRELPYHPSIEQRSIEKILDSLEL
ncbi:DUF6959 family protein [Roseofilum casamattae]|uniref:Cell division protein ZapA n=1 Tax=Roseofilum casamattae BLCC-M143 TaxID=3022442 RepID=A0ABT7C1V0_9CYAN|nr:hypothetical protein [Roseofilum casamattae]MDJ1185047.1 hypothetical protein [Roseofilum casamattae BLCC-M143]